MLIVAARLSPPVRGHKIFPGSFDGFSGLGATAGKVPLCVSILTLSLEEERFTFRLRGLEFLINSFKSVSVGAEASDSLLLIASFKVSPCCMRARVSPSVSSRVKGAFGSNRAGPLTSLNVTARTGMAFWFIRDVRVSTSDSSIVRLSANSIVVETLFISCTQWRTAKK